MADKKFNSETINEIIIKYDSGENPADLAMTYGVHPTTIRRYLRQQGRKLSRISHQTDIEPAVKQELRRVLAQFNVDNIDILISEIDKHFIVESRQGENDDAFEIIHI